MLAIVLDEFGQVGELMALDDLLEELVGDMAGEYDEDRRRSCSLKMEAI